jgi:hypothetical protein
MTTTQIYTLEDLYAQRFAPLSTLDLSRVSLTVQAYAQFLASDAAEQLNLFTQEQTLSRAVWGGAPAMAFDEVNEFNRGTPRKDTVGQEVHAPLFKLSASQGASEEFWNRANIKDLIDLMNGMDIGYSSRIRDEIAAAIFNNTIHTPVKDWLVDNSMLNKIQPFLNADSASIPTAPNGKTFIASSHTHYNGITGSTIASSDVNTLVNHVSEHVLGKVILFVDPAMPAILAGLGSTKFVARTPVVVVNQSTTQVARESFDPNADRGNMSVGYWDGYEVVTRSWVPTNYLVAMATGGTLGMPLSRRVDTKFPGLITGLEIRDGVLRIKENHFYMGFGAFNRAAGAVLDASTGNGSYTVPSGLVRK